MQRRIVVPLDGSVFAEQAVRHAQQLASEMVASLLPLRGARPGTGAE